MRGRTIAAAIVLSLTGCTATGPEPEGPAAQAPTGSSTATSQSPTIRPSSPTAGPTASTPQPTRSPTPTPPVRFDAAEALQDVRHLARDIGPREATSRNFAQAADFVEKRFENLGYRVRRTSVSVPAGNSWGTPVKKGRSVNVIAEPRGFDDRRRHVVVGAHLDTIPVSPGAEDNASGIAVLLELARLASREKPAIPVQFIAFGAEEPRGVGDAWHHFGSQQYVADLSRAERRAVRAMVSLDRVGVRADYVPVCQGGPRGAGLRADLRAAGRRADVRTRSCVNQSSDHWSYEKAGIPAVRLGSIPYSGYHSRRDTVSFVDRRQITKVGRLMWTWLQDAP